MNGDVDVLKLCIKKVMTRIGINNKRKLVNCTLLYCFGKYSELIQRHGIKRAQLRKRIMSRVQNIEIKKLRKESLSIRKQTLALGRFCEYIR